MKTLFQKATCLMAFGWFACRLLAQGSLDNPALPVINLTITAPAEGDGFPLGVDIPIRATAEDSQGAITRLEFLADGKVIGVSEILTLLPIPPGQLVNHEFVWRDAPFGQHELRVRGQGTLALPVLSAPTLIKVGQIKPAAAILLTQPADLADFHPGSDIELVADATDPRGLIQTVDFYANGEKIGTSVVDFCPPCVTPPCPLRPCSLPPVGATLTHRLTWRQPAEGKYAVEARSVLADGSAVVSQSVRIAVAGKPVATLKWVSPLTGSSWLTTDRIPFELTATDPVGEIRRVEFFAGDKKLGVSEILTKEAIIPGRPRQHGFLWTNPPPGTHVLLARAVDTGGAKVESRGNEIRVVAQPPTVTVTTVQPFALEGSPFNYGEFALERTGDLTRELAVSFEMSGEPRRGADYWLELDPCDACARPSVELVGTEIRFGAGQNTVRVGLHATWDGLLTVFEAIGEQARLTVQPPVIPAVVGAVPPYLAGQPDTAEVLVVDRRAPDAAEVILIGPPSGASLALGGAHLLRAIAVDPVGSIRRVEFTSDGKVIGVSEHLTREFDLPGKLRLHEVLWQPADLALRGEHALQARAKDAAGKELESRPVKVKLTGGPEDLPTVTIAPGKTPAFETGDLKSRTGSFVVSRKGGGGNANALVVYAQVTGSAGWDRDYHWTFFVEDNTGQPRPSGAFLPVIFPAGADQVAMTLGAISDTQPEGVETVVVRLIDPPIASLNAGLLPIPPSYAIGEPNEATVEIHDRFIEHPEVTLTVAGTEFPAGATVKMSATAVVPGQPIGGIVFLADGREIGQVPYCCDTCRCLPPVEGAPFSASFEWKEVPAGVHVLTARALTFANNLWESAPVTIVVGDGMKPSVVLTAPKPGASFAAPATIPVEATAVHPTQGIAAIRFYANGAEIGHALYCCEACFCLPAPPNKPFTGAVTWKSVPPSEYALVAKAFTLEGVVLESDPVKIAVQNGEPLPQLTITRPGSGESVRAGEKIRVVAVGAGRVGGITDVDLLLDGQTVAESHIRFIRAPGADESVEHSFEVTIPVGEHKLVARDQFDAQLISPPVTVAGVEPKPSVVLISPTEGARVSSPAPVHIMATAVHPDRAILGIRFFANGVEIGRSGACCTACDCADPAVGRPFTGEFFWKGAKPGRYQITAKAEAGADLLLESVPVNIEVVGLERPYVVITAPTDGASFAVPSTIHLEATASHPEATVSSIQFFANGALIGEARYCCDLCPCAAPFPGLSFTGGIDWTGVKAGEYKLVAKAMTSGAGILESEPILIRVGEFKSPSLVITAPTNGASFKLGGTVVVDTVGEDPNGFVNTVEFYANGLKIGESCHICVVDANFPPGTPLHNHVEWKPTKAGSYVLTAVGQFRSHLKVTTAPVVVRVLPVESGPRLAITQPLDGASVVAGEQFEVTAVGTGRFGGITDVELLVDGHPVGESHIRFIRAPEANEEVVHGFTVRLAAGAHELVARDLFDRTVKSPAIHVVATGVAPSITWVSPAAGASFKLGQTILLDVSAVDPKGVIFEVEFLDGEHVIGKSVYSCLTCKPGLGAPIAHQFEWNNAAAGEHLLRARNVRDDGVSVTSAPLRVVVTGEVGPEPFVVRTLPDSYGAGGKFTVRLAAKPAAGVAAYVVEDQPPHTLATPGAVGFMHPHWQVVDISHHGVFDSVTGKVKFGPFLDSEPRLLTYEVVANVPVALAKFEGVGSADGVSSPIGGDHVIKGSVRHPADRDPADDSIGANELTGYAAAWKNEQPWTVGLNPIPMDYVTRAAALWKGGEHYWFNSAAGVPPQCWINGVGAVAGSDPAIDRPSAGVAIRTVSLRSDGSAAVTIRLLAAPGTRSFAVEEQVLSPGAVTEVSGDGAFVGASRTLRWGPFFTGVNPTVSYVIRGEMAQIAASGQASFDGQSLPIRGDMPTDPAEASGRLVSVDTLADGSMQVSLESAELLQGAEFELQVSSDLKTWTPAGAFATEQVGGFARDSGAPGEGARFYRAVRVH